jgi:hypothetical protein
MKISNLKLNVKSLEKEELMMHKIVDDQILEEK